MKESEYEGFPDYFGEIQGLDVIRDPTIIMKKVMRTLEKLEIICKNCHTYKSIRHNREHITILCACECHIIYPPKKSRGYKYLWVRIPKENYVRDSNNGQNKAKKGIKER